MSSVKDARIVRTRQALQQALLALIERKPFEDISIREIAIEAGVHFATFYRHHDTKESLLNDIAAEQIISLVELVLPVVYKRDRHDVHLALCSYVEEHRTLWKTLLTGGAAGTLKKELMRLCLEPAIERVSKSCDIPVELVVLSTVSVQIEALTWWLTQPEGAVSIEALAHMMDRLVYSSLK